MAPEANQNGRTPAIRISFTIDTKLRKNMRIAAAHSDKEVGEWALAVLTAAANKAVKG